MISEKVGSNLGSSAITYLCFVYNILDDFGYHHFEAEEGKTMPLNPTSFSTIFNQRRATLNESSTPSIDAEQSVTPMRRRRSTRLTTLLTDA